MISKLRDERGIAMIIPIVLVVLLLTVAGFAGYRYYQSRLTAQGLTSTHHAVDGLSQSAVDWAKQNDQKQIFFYNGQATGLDNTSAFAVRIYDGTTSLVATKDSVVASLQAAGYSPKAKLHTPDPKAIGIVTDPDGFTGYSKNDNQPYWMVIGTTSREDVRVEITDKTYYNTANGYIGEHAVPSGKIVSLFSFHQTAK